MSPLENICCFSRQRGSERAGGIQWRRSPIVNSPDPFAYVMNDKMLILELLFFPTLTPDTRNLYLSASSEHK